MDESIEVVVGTYENFILGYKITHNIASNNYSLESSFTNDEHRGALRCLSASANGILASSSTDDSIRLLSLKRRKDIGSLFQHSGTVNCLTFYGKGYMFSTSEDGTICLWRSKNWELLRTLKGHKAKVNGMAVHPTGKLGFSVGKDKSILTWDLLTGKLAFQRKLEDVAESIHFTPSGEHYVLQYERRIEFCNIEDTKTVTEIPMKWRINSIVLVKDDLVAVGGEDKLVHVISLSTGKTILTLDCSDKGQTNFTRVKSVKVIEQKDKDPLVFVGIANGNIKAFKLDLTEGAEKSELLLDYNASVRLTCMAVFSPNAQYKETVRNQTKKSKKKKAPVPAKESEDSDKEEDKNGEDSVEEEDENGEDNDEEEDENVEETDEEDENVDGDEEDENVDGDEEDENVGSDEEDDENGENSDQEEDDNEEEKPEPQQRGRSLKRKKMSSEDTVVKKQVPSKVSKTTDQVVKKKKKQKTLK